MSRASAAAGPRMSLPQPYSTGATATVGQRLRCARLAAGLTMGQFARLVDLKVSEVSAYESDKAQAGDWLLRSWADQCHVSFRWLRDGTRTPVVLPPGIDRLPLAERWRLVSLLSILPEDGGAA